MELESKLALKLDSKGFAVTAECLPRAGTSASVLESCARTLSKGVTAVNVADNHYGLGMSSITASAALLRSGIEPVLQLTTRDRNRIALQSDLMGAACLGIRNVLCLSGYHQALIGYPESANVYDIDSVQLIGTVNKMNEGLLLNDTKIEGNFYMLIGAVANPYLKPMELNLLRLGKKAAAGARFIQTQAVFDVKGFEKWLDSLVSEGLTERVAVLAGILPLTSAAEAKKLAGTYTDLVIPDSVIERMQAIGDPAAQRKEGLAVCADIARQLKSLKGLRGIHILSGGNEAIVPELIEAAGL